MWNRKALALLIILAMPLALAFIPVGYAAWLSGGWSYRVKITISKTNIGEDLTDFPVLLTLNSSAGTGKNDLTFIFTELTTNSLKLAVTTSDGTTECYVEVEKWDNTNKQACLWVKVPTVTTASDTILYMYYDSTHADNTVHVGAPNTTPAENTWDSNFKMVVHMLDDPDTSHVRDSTSHNYDGAKVGANQPLANSTGLVDGAQFFDGSNDEISSGLIDPNSQLGQTFTIESWLYPYRQADYDGAWGWHIADTHKGMAFQWVTTAWGFTYGTGTTWISETCGTFTLRKWLKVTVVLKTGAGGYIKIYLDNAAPLTASVTTAVSHDTTWRIGHPYTGAGRYFDGLEDEIRCSAGERDANWIKASYYSEIDGLNSWGTQESQVTVSNIGLTSTSNDEATTMYANWTSQVSMSYYIFGWNITTTMTNDSAVPFPGGVTWSNVTKTLTSTVSYVIDWLIYANNTDGIWASTSNQFFTVSANITFYFDSGGGIRSVGTDVSNGSTTQYYVASLSLGALPSSGYSLISWNWTDLYVGSSTSNPLTFTVANRTTVWAHFQDVGAVFTYAIARFEFSPSNPGNTTQILFNGSQSFFTVAITDYSWNFGDGNTTSSAAQDWIRHAYGTDGAYNVTLTVSSTATNTSAMVFHLVNVTASGGTTVIITPGGGGSFGWGAILLILLIPGSIVVLVLIRRKR